MTTVIYLPYSPSMMINGNSTPISFTDWANVVLHGSELTDFNTAHTARSVVIQELVANNTMTTSTTANGNVIVSETLTLHNQVDLVFPVWDHQWQRYSTDTANVTFPADWYTVSNT